MQITYSRIYCATMTLTMDVHHQTFHQVALATTSRPVVEATVHSKMTKKSQVHCTLWVRLCSASVCREPVVGRDKMMEFNMEALWFCELSAHLLSDY
jgi:hypothetical protein